MAHPKDPCGPCGTAFGAPTEDEDSAPQTRCTYCDGDRKDNVWVEGLVDADGRGGLCMLDSMTEAQIIGILEVNERAREDLRRVTSDPFLHTLADTVPRLPLVEESDKLQSEVNKASESIPFYAIFRGQPPFAQ